MIKYISCKQDSYISKQDCRSNFNNSKVLFVGQSYNNLVLYKSLMQFNLSSVFQYTFIDSAILQLYVYSKTIETKPNIKIYKLTDNFNQYTVTWNTCPESIFTNYSTSIYDNNINNYINIDITNIVKKELLSKKDTLNILISSEYNSPCLIAFASNKYIILTKRPTLILNYKF